MIFPKDKYFLRKTNHLAPKSLFFLDASSDKSDKSDKSATTHKDTIKESPVAFCLAGRSGLSCVSMCGS